jgi:hypothetical protein
MGMHSLSITAASRGRSSGSGSRLWSAGAAVMRRFSVFSRSGMLSSSTLAPGDVAPQHALQLSVRIGIATGRLPHGCDLNNCAVKDKAKSELITYLCASWVSTGSFLTPLHPNAGDARHTVLQHVLCALHVPTTQQCAYLLVQTFNQHEQLPRAGTLLPARTHVCLSAHLPPFACRRLRV